MAARRRRIRGDRAFKKILRRLPDAIREEVLQMLDETGDAILVAQRADVPKGRTGKLSGGLSKRLLRGSLRLRVGLVGKPVNRRLWYARIVQSGRKAQDVNVRRRTPSGGVSSYVMHVRALAGRPFVHSERTKQIRDTMGGKLSKFWQRTLERAAQGVNDD